MSFEHPTGTPLFVASISNSNAAFLDGSTVSLAEYAYAAITLPLDIDLWHRRLAHHHLAGVRMLLDKNLVTGMHLDSKSAPDPICEPCLAGKMHSNPFPSSQWCATRPLELVHSDVHQVPCPSFSGFHYWVTFIDDYFRFRFILPIKAKSDVFEAFKNFKAYVFKSHLEMTVNAQLSLCIYLITDLGDDSQSTRGKAVQLQIKYLSM